MFLPNVPNTCPPKTNRFQTRPAYNAHRKPCNNIRFRIFPDFLLPHCISDILILPLPFGEYFLPSRCYFFAGPAFRRKKSIRRKKRPPVRRMRCIFIALLPDIHILLHFDKKSNLTTPFLKSLYVMYIKIFAAACKMHISPRPQRPVKTAALKARQRHITASLIFA